MAVEFPPEATLAGQPKIVNRLSWARSYLKKMGAISDSTRGIWAITNKGNEYLAMGPDAANEALELAHKAVRAEMLKAKKRAAYRRRRRS
jgi:restriction system protein